MGTQAIQAPLTVAVYGCMAQAPADCAVVSAVSPGQHCQGPAGTAALKTFTHQLWREALCCSSLKTHEVSVCE